MPEVPSPNRQVALLIESSRAYGRGLLNGIASYAGEHGRWSLRHQEMAINADPPQWLTKWNGDGVLVRAETQKMVQAIEKLALPAIDLRCLRPAGETRDSDAIAGLEKIPGFDTDDVSVVRLAVDHLRERGFTKFGFCGFGGANYSQRRLCEMRRYLHSLGHELVAYESPGPAEISGPAEAETPVQATTFGAEQSGMLDEQGLSNWLSSLDKPIGVLACNDIRAQQMLNACHELQIDAPDEIAVIGVDNDDVICPLCSPPLTSVEPDTHRVGYEAAAMLDRMMSGEAVTDGVTWIPARRIVVRNSTDAIPVDDTEFVKAYRLIRENAYQGITVQDVADAVPMSRRALERRMRTYLDQSPAEVIAGIRLARIKELLETTSQPIKKIARLTGFHHDEHLAKFFKKLTGVPPGRYRKKHRP